MFAKNKNSSTNTILQEIKNQINFSSNNENEVDDDSLLLDNLLDNELLNKSKSMQLKTSDEDLINQFNKIETENQKLSSDNQNSFEDELLMNDSDLELEDELSNENEVEDENNDFDEAEQNLETDKNTNDELLLNQSNTKTEENTISNLSQIKNIQSNIIEETKKSINELKAFLIKKEPEKNSQLKIVNNNSQSFENVMIELITPKVNEFLEKNLSEIVNKIVKLEIEKIVKESKS